jgi:hypothetical protein
MIDKNAAHQTGGNAKEVCPVAPLDLTLVDQADIDLVDERGWLQRMSSGFSSHLRRSHTPEVAVYERDQLIERVPSPIAHSEEQVGNPRHVWLLIRHPVTQSIGPGATPFNNLIET